MKKIISIAFITLALVSCEEEVFTGLVENNITEYGDMYVTSNPQGYKLYIDNKYMSLISPDTIPFVTEGLHKLTLKHDLFSDSSMNVEVKKQSIVSLSIDMMKSTRFYSNIICTSIPSEAHIYLNDQPTGKITTAVISKVYPGNIEVKFIRNGCRDDSVTVKVKGGEYTEINRTLNDTTRGVDYRTINSKIFSNELSKVVVDKYNNKWIGTIGNGLMKYDGKSWTSYENSNILHSRIILDMLIDSKDRLWVGTANGISVYDGAMWRSYDDKLPSLTVTTLEEDPYGNIWIGTLGGLVKYNNSSFQIYNSGNSGLPENIITCLTFSKNGDLWVGTSQFGVVRFSNNEWTMYQSFITRYDSRISKYIGDLTFDKNGVLWVFHLGGLNLGRNAIMRYNNEEWREFTLPLPITVEIAFCKLDNDDNIWMASKEGLIKYNETQPIRMFNNYEYSFYVTHCTSIATDNNGDAWVTTMGGGIVKLKKGYF